MSSLLRKPRIKKKRRPDGRLHLTDRDTGVTRVMGPCGAPGKIMIEEVRTDGLTVRVIERHPAGDLVMVSETRPDDEHILELVIRRGTGAVARRVAGDVCPWFFPEDDSNNLYVSVSQAGLANEALLLGLATTKEGVRCIPPDLAEFIDVAQPVVLADKVFEVNKDPRYRAIRDYDFQVDTAAALGFGPYATKKEAKVRHLASNYDDMLAQSPGALLDPAAYETVRAGVDVLVRNAMLRRRPA